MSQLHAGLSLAAGVLGIFTTVRGFYNVLDSQSPMQGRTGIAQLAAGVLAGIVSSRAYECSFQLQSSAHPLAGAQSECITHMKRFPESATLKKIARAFGGTAPLCALPVLRWQSSFQRSPNYIDGIYPKDVSAPVMRGADPTGRPFITLHTKGKRWGNSHEGIEALFQRFSNEERTWASGTTTRMPLVDHDLKKEELEKLSALIKGGKVDLNSDHYFSDIDRGWITLA